jgi:polysaccharide biosynthesis/export protein PslD
MTNAKKTDRVPRDLCVPSSRRAAALSIAVALALGLSGCAAAVKPNPPPHEAPIPASSSYRIQVGDLLAVQFYRAPELNQDVAVRPDGMISLQYVRDVPAAGLSPEQLSADLVKRYKGELARPEISVSVKSLGGQRFFIGGEVGQQGMQPLHGELTLFQAVQQAGGFLKSAKRDQVVLVRRDIEGQATGYTVDLERVETGEHPEDDVLLRPYDVVYVPRSAIANLNLFVEMYIKNNLPVQPGMGIPF